MATSNDDAKNIHEQTRPPSSASALCPATLDDEAFGAATTFKPKFTAHADPASQWTAARKGPAFFAYSTHYLIDTDHSVIVDVDASRSNKTAEVGAIRKMLDRTEERFGVKPDWIAADTQIGLGWSAANRTAHREHPMHRPCCWEALGCSRSTPSRELNWPPGNECRK